MIQNSEGVSTSLKYLDLSWNKIGQAISKKGDLASALGEALRYDCLRHLDLSYNEITLTECMLFGQVLKSNTYLFGFHVIGNECWIDDMGFVRPPHYVDIIETIKEEHENFKNASPFTISKLKSKQNDLSLKLSKPSLFIPKGTSTGTSIVT